MIFVKQCRSLRSSLCSFLHYPVALSLSGPNILRSTLFSNILNLRFFLSVKDQVSHPNKTTGKIIVWYISIFIFIVLRNGRQKDSAPKDASIPFLQSVLSFFRNGILIRQSSY
jgi:hypothetical protein